jgi:hypothetical protein
MERLSSSHPFLISEGINIIHKQDWSVLRISTLGPPYFGKPDPDLHSSEKLDPDPHNCQNSGNFRIIVKSLIRIRIKVMWARKPRYNMIFKRI